ncbi:MAG: amino acid permease [Candidatus Omnitrophica bacterium]|nr:amino acid permease [Candidatus Omnitrophota bacterium]
MSERTTFVRAMGRWDATMLVVGCVVGVGIFRTASAIAAHLPSPSLILLVWIVGGIVSLCGALCYAELAAMFPATGGDYVYIERIYGRLWAFLFGWTKLFIERTGTIAILGFVFAEYLRRVVPYDEATLRWTSAAVIVTLTAVNVFGVRWGTLVQNVFTVIKIAALASLILAGVMISASGQSVSPVWTMPPFTGSTLQALGVAFVFVLWTFGGWTEAAYVAEEVREPTRNLPRAIIGGLLLTTCLYVLVNWSYLVCVPIEQLPQTPLVASEVMQRLLGAQGAMWIAVMVACSAFGALNGYILTGARILYAVGRDFPLFRKLAAVHPTHRTPSRALWTNAAIAVLLVLTKTLDQIMTYSTVVISIFFIMTVIGVMVLRRRAPRQSRPYRAWGYPLTPLLFSLVMCGFIIDVCIKQPTEALFGFGLLALGLPLYALSLRQRSENTA